MRTPTQFRQIRVGLHVTSAKRVVSTELASRGCFGDRPPLSPATAESACWLSSSSAPERSSRAISGSPLTTAWRAVFPDQIFAGCYHYSCRPPTQGELSRRRSHGSCRRSRSLGESPTRPHFSLMLRDLIAVHALHVVPWSTLPSK